MIALLILHAEMLGYKLTFGDAYRDPRVTYGHKDSLHRKRLAVDLNLFLDGGGWHIVGSGGSVSDHTLQCGATYHGNNSATRSQTMPAGSGKMAPSRMPTAVPPAAITRTATET